MYMYELHECTLITTDHHTFGTLCIPWKLCLMTVLDVLSGLLQEGREFWEMERMLGKLTKVVQRFEEFSWIYSYFLHSYLKIFIRGKYVKLSYTMDSVANIGNKCFVSNFNVLER